MTSRSRGIETTMNYIWKLRQSYFSGNHTRKFVFLKREKQINFCERKSSLIFNSVAIEECSVNLVRH